MKFWGKIRGYILRGKNADTATARGPRTGEPPLWDTYLTPAMCVATVFRCVKLLSESVANLPIKYLRYKNGIYEDARNPRIDYLLNVQPDTAVSAFDFWRQVGIELLLDGNAYIVPFYDAASMELERLALCRRGTVQHDYIADVYTVRDAVNGISGRFTESEIIHLKGFTFNNIKVGVSVLSYARLTTSIAGVADRETRSRFANGGTVKGLVSNDKGVKGFGSYQDEQLEALAKILNTRFNIEGENIVSSPGQTGFTQISMSSVDMQFLESRKFTVLELCRFFSVPPSFVYADTSNNYKSVEQADADFLGHTLHPLLRNIETELLRKLVTPRLASRYKFQFDRRELFACNLNGMMDYSTKQLQLGFSVNEVRRQHNLPAVPGGDAAMVSANLKCMNEMLAETASSKIQDNNGEK